MGYSTTTLVQRLLAQALTSSTPETIDSLGDLMNIGNTLDHNNVTSDVVNTFISDADAEIDATISLLYAVPLRKRADKEMSLVEDVASLDDEITVSDASDLHEHEILIVTNGNIKDSVEILSMTGNVITLVSALGNGYDAVDSRVVRIKYPDPIPYISARMAAANIYDKFFAAQADKNESTYGKFFRSMARLQLQRVINGIAPLVHQLRVGTLSVNPNLIKRYRVTGGSDDYKLDDPGR